MIAILDCADYYNASPYLPSETILGQPIVNGDQCACDHPFCDEDIAYLQSFGATIVDALPEWWAADER